MMDRRAFIAGAIALSAAPLSAGAQQARRVPRIAWLLAQPPIPEERAFLDGMRELGWAEGVGRLSTAVSAGGWAVTEEGLC